MSRFRFAYIIVMLSLLMMPDTTAAAQIPTYKAATTLWRASDAGFAGWERDAVSLGGDGTLRLDGAKARPGTDPYAAGKYNGRNYYNGGSFFVGEAVSPAQTAPFPFTQAIASWNAQTPAGTWIEAQIRAQVGSKWTKWYSMGVWASGTGTVERHSVNGQADANGSVSTDTLMLGTRTRPKEATAYQLKARLFAVDRSASPTLKNAAVAVSTTPSRPAKLTPGNPGLWNKKLAVPGCSQMVYKDGGVAWCSPTSVSMMLAYWQKATGPCEPRVRAAVAGVFDRTYKGHGNWPFNAAYAVAEGSGVRGQGSGTADGKGLEGYVTRFTSLAEAERWIGAGVPVAVSFGWAKGQLGGAAIVSSNGHLAVLTGFDAKGNPIVNDPAAGSDATVGRTYNRAEFERLWLGHSGGTVYVVYPVGWKVPEAE